MVKKLQIYKILQINAKNGQRQSRGRINMDFLYWAQGKFDYLCGAFGCHSLFWAVMSAAVETLAEFGVEIEKRVISAHRTPDLMVEFAKTAKERGIGVIIAGAGGAAHVAGVVAGLTTVPVIGVPMQTKALGGLDSLLSIVQMPGGVPVATVAINGAKNAALLAVEILALSDKALENKLVEYRKKQTETVLKAEI